MIIWNAGPFLHRVLNATKFLCQLFSLLCQNYKESKHLQRLIARSRAKRSENMQIPYFLIELLPMNTFLPWIVSSLQWENYSSFYYTRENIMRKVFEIFKVLQFQKRIASAATIRGNAVTILWWVSHTSFCKSELPR